jgi:hypothetical protein
MARSLAFVLFVVLAAPGCKRKHARFEGAMPVRFGACAGPAVAWVSGPRPEPFTAQEAEGIWAAATDLVNVIDVAAKAGFVQWQLTTPKGLAARPDR